MRKVFLAFLFSILLVEFSFATHQRAAEITYKHIEGLTFEFTIQMWTKDSSPADDTREYMPIYWGDGTADEIKRVEPAPEPVPGVEDMAYMHFIGRHTYPAPGYYIISVEDPNRNGGVINIPNSINVPMYIETEIMINPFLGVNNSVQLLNPPIDKGCAGKPFVHNPAAWDVDGDSLSYQLVICKGAGGFDIPGYRFPNFHDTTMIFEIDVHSGEILWDFPIIQGEYNVAFVVSEWRYGIKVGSVRRDMQIDIVACDHEPPEIYTIDDTCVIAGDYLEFDVTAEDPESTRVELTAFGGPFELALNPAKMDPDDSVGTSPFTRTFQWLTSCSNVRLEPYTAVFKARDDGVPVNLVSFKTVFIKVNAPAPENLQTEALGNGINLSWTKSICENAVGYRIYRRSGESGWEPDYCETGVPPYTGFTLIEEIDDINTTDYRDENFGLGLVHGINYCYRITAFFIDEAESIASNESCAYLKRDVPIITHVSNDSTNLPGGEALVIWSKPIELDTIQYPGPYKYLLYRSENLQWTSPEIIAEFGSLNDTIYLDTEINLNVHTGPYSYRVDLESETVGFIGSSQRASSVFIQLQPTDEEIRLEWFPVVPWNNERFVIYRKGPGQNEYDSLDVTNLPYYRDIGLENEQEYCFYIKTIGHYSLPGLIDPIINFSQLACEIPVDNRPPCSPVLEIDSTYCTEVKNVLEMIIPPDTCMIYDSCDCKATRYDIYYTPSLEGEFEFIGSIDYILDDWTYYTHDDIPFVVGCYYVKAIDDMGNESGNSKIVCVDSDACPFYCLPNVFTPNGDGRNDLFVPMDCNGGGAINPYSTIDHVNMTIFNRWGKVMFTTNDPMIKWDGRNRNNNQICSDGVYFYVCEVYEITKYGIKPSADSPLKGSVTIFGSKPQ